METNAFLLIRHLYKWSELCFANKFWRSDRHLFITMANLPPDPRFEIPQALAYDATDPRDESDIELSPSPDTKKALLANGPESKPATLPSGKSKPFNDSGEQPSPGEAAQNSKAQPGKKAGSEINLDTLSSSLQPQLTSSNGGPPKAAPSEDLGKTPSNATVPPTGQDSRPATSAERPKCTACQILGLSCDRGIPRCRSCASLERKCTYEIGSR